MIQENLLETLGIVIREQGDMTPCTLSNTTHVEPPWKGAKVGVPPREKRECYIIHSGQSPTGQPQAGLRSVQVNEDILACHDRRLELTLIYLSMLGQANGG
jgi:hypothetical protein